MRSSTRRGLYPCGWGRLNEESNPLSFPDSPYRQHWCYQRLINLIINIKRFFFKRHVAAYAYSCVCAWTSKKERAKDKTKLRPMRNNRATLSSVYHEVACLALCGLVVFSLYQRRCVNFSLFTVLSLLFLKTRNFCQSLVLWASQQC